MRPHQRFHIGWKNSILKVRRMAEWIVFQLWTLLAVLCIRDTEGGLHMSYIHHTLDRSREHMYRLARNMFRQYDGRINIRIVILALFSLCPSHLNSHSPTSLESNWYLRAMFAGVSASISQFRKTSTTAPTKTCEVVVTGNQEGSSIYFPCICRLCSLTVACVIASKSHFMTSVSFLVQNSFT